MSKIFQSQLFEHTFQATCAAIFVASNLYILLGATLEREVSSIIFGYIFFTSIFFTFWLVVALFFSVLIGWPLYWLAHKFKVVSWGTAILSGVFVALVPLWILKILGPKLPFTFLGELYLDKRGGLIAFFSLVVCGAIGGALFYKLQTNASKKTNFITSVESSKTNIANRNAKLTGQDWFWIVWVAFATTTVTGGGFILFLPAYVFAIFFGYLATRKFSVFFDRSHRELFVLKVLAVTLPTFAFFMWMQFRFV